MTDEKKWFVVRVKTGCEKSVMTLMQETIKDEGMDAYFDDVLLPKEDYMEIKKGKKVKSQRKFFPGYLLIKMIMDEKAWHLINSLNNVVGFIGGTKDAPLPITEKEANKILDRMQQTQDKPKPRVLYEVGEVIRVIDGPFADFNGVVEDINYDKSRLRVAVLIFGRSTPVELEFAQVERSE